MTGRHGDTYVVTNEQREAFQRDGFVHLPGVMSDEELVEIASVYDDFLRGKIEVPGKDRYDMTSGSYGDHDAMDYAIANVMLPRRYYPSWKGNLFERRAESIAAQLCG